MDDFYKEYILDHYRNPRNFGHLENPTAVAEDLNPLCGDKIAMELLVGADGKIEDVRFSGKGCAISQASASMLTESLKGKTLEEVRAARLSRDYDRRYSTSSWTGDMFVEAVYRSLKTK